MRAIWKYNVPLMDGGVNYGIPVGAEIVSVSWDPIGPESHLIAVYAKVNPKETAMKSRTFQVAGTGHQFPDTAKYLGSVTHGGFMWHVLEQL